MKKHEGMTLLELLISMGISSLVLAGVLQLYATSTVNTIAHEGQARVQEHSRFLLTRLEKDIDQAGSGPCFGLHKAVELDRFKSVLGAKNSKYDEFGMQTFVAGETGTGSNGTDKLVIRFADQAKRIPVVDYSAGDASMTIDSNDADYARLEQYQVVYAGNCSRMTAFMLTAEPDENGTITFETDITAPSDKAFAGQYNTSSELGLGNTFTANNPNLSTVNSSLSYVFAGESQIEYYIGDSENGTCATGSPEFCSLYRNDTELVEGVHAFDVQYGWEDTSGNLNYADWEGVKTADVANLIDRVKVAVTVNSLDTVPTEDKPELLEKNIAQVFMIRNQLPVY